MFTIFVISYVKSMVFPFFNTLITGNFKPDIISLNMTIKLYGNDEGWWNMQQ